MSYSEAYSNPKKEEEGVSCIDIRTAQRLLKQRIWIASQDNHTTHVRENTTTTTTNVPTRKSVPRSNRQLDHMKTSWSSLRDAHCKPILQGTVKGGRRQGRQRKRWEDIRERTGLEFAKSQRAVENREKWRKLVVKSSWVPDRPSRLRNRWIIIIIIPHIRWARSAYEKTLRINRTGESGGMGEGEWEGGNDILSNLALRPTQPHYQESTVKRQNNGLPRWPRRWRWWKGFQEEFKNENTLILRWL